MSVHYAVDRIDGDVAVLVDDEGAVVTVSWLDLPEGTEEGSIVAIDFDDDGDPDWSSALLDEDERLRREQLIADRD